MRISEKKLEQLVHVLNVATKSPVSSYTRDSAGNLTAQVGNFHLDYAYGGVKLVRMVSSGGAIEDTLSMGFQSRRATYELVSAYIRGVDSGK